MGKGYDEHEERQELMTKTPQPPRRADAEENRARILNVARSALAVSSNVSLNTIAKQAGVGPGTLYRHFPTREALVLEVYHHDVSELIEFAPILLAEHPPLDALRFWFDRFAAYGRIKHGLADALHVATRADLAAEYSDPVVEAIRVLLGAGQATGELRPDVSAEEVLQLVGFLWRSDLTADWQARSNHLLGIVIDGLRIRPGAEY